MSKSRSAIKLLVASIENQCLNDFFEFDILNEINLNNSDDNYKLFSKILSSNIKANEIKIIFDKLEIKNLSDINFSESRLISSESSLINYAIKNGVKNIENLPEYMFDFFVSNKYYNYFKTFNCYNLSKSHLSDFSNDERIDIMDVVLNKYYNSVSSAKYFKEYVNQENFDKFLKKANNSNNFFKIFDNTSNFITANPKLIIKLISTQKDFSKEYLKNTLSALENLHKLEKNNNSDFSKYYSNAKTLLITKILNFDLNKEEVVKYFNMIDGNNFNDKVIRIKGLNEKINRRYAFNAINQICLNGLYSDILYDVLFAFTKNNIVLDNYNKNSSIELFLKKISKEVKHILLDLNRSNKKATEKYKIMVQFLYTLAIKEMSLENKSSSLSLISNTKDLSDDKNFKSEVFDESLISGLYLNVIKSLKKESSKSQLEKEFSEYIVFNELNNSKSITKRKM